MRAATEQDADPSPARHWLSPWRWAPRSLHSLCSLGGVERDVWELASGYDSDDFSDPPDEWSDSHGNVWLHTDWDCGICFFGWWCQDSRCAWATNWYNPIHECQAHASTPTALLLLSLASRGELSTLEIAEDGVAWLLDAAILLGKPEAAAKIVELFPQVQRTLRFWSWRDLANECL